MADFKRNRTTPCICNYFPSRCGRLTLTEVFALWRCHQSSRLRKGKNGKNMYVDWMEVRRGISVTSLKTAVSTIKELLYQYSGYTGTSGFL